VTSGPAVEVRGLRVRRGHREVLHGLSFTVGRGSVTGLIGPSGCGKTTLMRAIAGVQIVAGGSVTVLGRPAGSRVLRHVAGYATQDASLYADLTVTENLRYFATVLGAARSDPVRVIDAVSLDAARRPPPGRRQPVRWSAAPGQPGYRTAGPARAVRAGRAHRRARPGAAGRAVGVFRGLASRGMTLVVSSHVMDEAARCGRLLLMRDGDILTDGTPAELLAASGTADLDQAFLRLIRARQEARA